MKPITNQLAFNEATERQLTAIPNLKNLLDVLRCTKDEWKGSSAPEHQVYRHDYACIMRFFKRLKKLDKASSKIPTDELTMFYECWQLDNLLEQLNAEMQLRQPGDL